MRLEKIGLTAVLAAVVMLSGCGFAVRKSAAVGFRLSGTQKHGSIIPAGAESGGSSPATAADHVEPAQDDDSVCMAPCDGHAMGIGESVTAVRNTISTRWQLFKTWFVTTYRKNTRWPEPYESLAEQGYRDQFRAQAEAGRQYVVGLFGYHFEPGTGRLNQAGRQRLDSVLRGMPPGLSTIYVEAAPTPNETEQRLEAVRAALQHHSLGSNGIEVALLREGPAATSGAEASRAARNLTESVGTFPRWMDRNTRINGQQNNQGSQQ